jgi:hypothetical protein
VPYSKNNKSSLGVLHFLVELMNSNLRTVLPKTFAVFSKMNNIRKRIPQIHPVALGGPKIEFARQVLPGERDKLKRLLTIAFAEIMNQVR